MQELTNGRFAARLSARNTSEHVRTHLTLRFSLLVFALFTAGMLLWQYTPLRSLPALSSYIDRLFADPFAKCDTARAMVRAVLRAAWTDISLLALIAVSGMTYFSTAACRVLLGAHALRLGLCMSGMIATVMNGAAHGRLCFFACFFAQLLVTGILLAQACEAVVFSFGYRDAGRSLRSGRDTLSTAYFLCTVSHIGAVILAHTAHAMLVHLLM